MASSKEYLHFILEQLSDLDEVSYRPTLMVFPPLLDMNWGQSQDSRFYLEMAQKHRSCFQITSML